MSTRIPPTETFDAPPQDSLADRVAGMGSQTAVDRFRRLSPVDRRVRVLIATALAAAYGATFALLLPRGPITTGQALVTMGLSALIGFLIGVTLRSRWALFLAPAAFAVVFELLRIDATGPTVDGIQLSSTYGVMAFVVGRGLLSLMTLAPMVVGVVLGAATARAAFRSSPARHGWSRLALYLRRSVTAVTVLALVLFAVALGRPAQTSPILGADGEPLPGSVAELTRVEIGGHDLGLMIRGNDVTNPVMLFLAGGPGGSEVGAMRRHAQGLEEDFVVATFDQRGTGRSHDQLEPTETLTLDAAVADVIEVSNYLRQRFAQEQIYLVGQSWGSTLAVLAAQAEPRLFRAIVGVGQMVSQRGTDELFYEDTLAWAQQEGNQDLANELTAIGPPPYEDIGDYETALAHEHEVYSYDHRSNSEGEGGFSENLFVEEYTLLEQVHTLGAFLDVFHTLYPQLQEIDFRVDATRLDVPVYLVQGRHEARGRAALVTEWFEMLQAPRKELIVLDTSGHRPIFEQPDEFHVVMTDTVLADNEAGG